MTNLYYWSYYRFFYTLVQFIIQNRDCSKEIGRRLGLERGAMKEVENIFSVKMSHWMSQHIICTMVLQVPYKYLKAQ